MRLEGSWEEKVGLLNINCFLRTFWGLLRESGLDRSMSSLDCQLLQGETEGQTSCFPQKKEQTERVVSSFAPGVTVVLAVSQS